MCVGRRADKNAKKNFFCCVCGRVAIWTFIGRFGFFSFLVVLRTKNATKTITMFLRVGLHSLPQL